MRYAQIKDIHDLPATLQKSFYGKAQVITTTDNRKYLKSYNTIIGFINKNGKFKKMWNGYSATTQKHINDFISQYSNEVKSYYIKLDGFYPWLGISGDYSQSKSDMTAIYQGGKKWYESLPTYKGDENSKYIQRVCEPVHTTWGDIGR